MAEVLHRERRGRLEADRVVAVVEANRRAVDRIVARGRGVELLRILHAAEERLRRRLLDAHARGLGARWTAAQLAATRALVADAISAVERNIAALLTRAAGELAVRGMRDVVAILRLQEHLFSGVVRPLALEQALRFDHVLAGVRSSRLRQCSASVHRYGVRMISEFERTMQTGIVTNATTAEMIDALVAHGGPGGLFRERRYFAERIVRTELLASYNLGAQAAMVEEVEDFPDLARIILAHHDRRTAPDSIFVHGEVRALNADFVDGAGRRYRVPPARPNDREIVIPWRRAWTMPAEFRPNPWQVRADAREAGHGRSSSTERIAASS